MKLDNLGSLITYDEDGRTYHLDYIWVAGGKGAFEPNIGRVDVSEADAETHNRLLSEAKINGLDTTCEVRQGGYFYLATKPLRIRTWDGQPVADRVRLVGKTTIEFDRRDRTFRGTIPRDSDAIFIKRVR